MMPENRGMLKREERIGISWQPGIGDPTITGWVIVLAYFTTAAICWLASVGARAKGLSTLSSLKKETGFWAIASVSMAIFGFNKQLDLQTLFTQVGRQIALSGGWYDERQSVQLIFILILFAAAIVAAVILFLVFAKLAPEIRSASTGLCFLAAFIVIRAASFHHADRLLGQNETDVRWNALLELGSITFVAISGLRYLQRQRTGQ